MEQINWSTEWLTSLLWLARTFALTLVGFALIVWLLIRRSRWGRQFWRLSSVYFIPRRRGWLSWRPILTVALLLLLTLISVRLDILLSFQGNDMFTSLQQLDAAAFLEVHRNLRHSGHSQRPARTGHVLHRTGTDHSLAALAQSADGRGLADWCGLPPRPIRPRTG
jgi:hypothetical protein